MFVHGPTNTPLFAFKLSTDNWEVSAQLPNECARSKGVICAPHSHASLTPGEFHTTVRLDKLIQP